MAERKLGLVRVLHRRLQERNSTVPASVLLLLNPQRHDANLTTDEPHVREPPGSEVVDEVAGSPAEHAMRATEPPLFLDHAGSPEGFFPCRIVTRASDGAMGYL